MAAKSNAQSKMAENDIAEQFEETSKKLQSIRKEAADALPGLRNTLQSTLDKYNGLARISDSGAARLEIVEAGAGQPVDAGRSAAPVVADRRGGDDDAAASSQGAGEDKPQRNRKQKPTRRTPAEAKPLDPNDIQLSDPDGVVVPDYKTEENGAAPADSGDDEDGLGFLGGDDDA